MAKAAKSKLLFCPRLKPGVKFQTQKLALAVNKRFLNFLITPNLQAGLNSPPLL
jgi:hypothetical protein